ncbi:MAG: 30S ribosomal protein S6e [Thermoplasmata archaeon]|nr:30S ribosomal protein S6e [Thermoplasmata archaeon]
MVEFKVVIADPKTGKCYGKAVSGHHANSLVGKRIGDSIDGIFVGMPGFKLMITGGSDAQGISMRQDLPGMRRKRILVSKSTGFRPKHPGVRKRRMLRGNTVGPDISQINLRVVKHGSKPIEEALSEKEA